jgi:hypothetical protein
MPDDDHKPDWSADGGDQPAHNPTTHPLAADADAPDGAVLADEGQLIPLPLKPREGGSIVGGTDPLTPLRSHPAFPVMDQLARHVGVARDLVMMLEFLSLAAGRMVMPVHLDLQTDQVDVDLNIANRIMDLRCAHVDRVDTYVEFRTLEE